MVNSNGIHPSQQDIHTNIYNLAKHASSLLMKKKEEKRKEKKNQIDHSKYIHCGFF